MKAHAYAVKSAKKSLTPFAYSQDKLGPYDVEIAIICCGLCHSDLNLIDNDWKSSTYPLIAGHEVVGTIVNKGVLATNVKVGARVGVSWQKGACLECEQCLSGHENVCAQKTFTCIRNYGGFADKMVADSRFVYPIPKTLKSAYAAPLLCAGATVYAPLKKYGIGPGHSVAILGIGGLGHLAIQFAKAFGATVTAISHSHDKHKEASKFGADYFVLQTAAALKKHLSQFDFILSTTSEDLDWNLIVSLLRPNGTLCFLGKPNEKISVEVGLLTSGQRNICGSTVAPRAVINEMLAVAAQYKIVPQIEQFRLIDINKAITHLRKGKARYRVVLTRNLA